MPYPEIEQLLKKAMGLDAQSIGSATVERAVGSRQRALKLRDPEAYWDLLSGSEVELQELIEAVVVPETWFFRDRESFAALAGTVLPEWLRTHPQGVLRLLSLPCSSGEEPFSMAMALLDAGLAPERFAIDAIDISARALELAERGLFSPNSFRGEVLAFRERHFEPTPNGHRVSEAVRRQVRFRQGNLFSAATGELYDVVFCRNLLIYFDRQVQDRAVKVIERMLTSKGFLFVGPSETSLLGSHNFHSARWPMAFAFRKGAAPAPTPVAPARPAHAAARAVPRPAPKPLAAPRLPPRPPAAPVAGGPELQLERAEQLANAGRLTEAVQLCERCMAAHGPSARAYHLLGLVSDAGGDQAAAAGHYRKALYLEPTHQATLTHLALLLEKQGDAAGSELLRSRARRQQHRGDRA